MRSLDDMEDRRLGATFLETSWLFQAIFAGPLSAALAISAFVRLLDSHGPVYDFVTHLCTSILLAAIVFIVLIQRKQPVKQRSKALTLKFEVAKSVIATVLWIWLMMDAAFGPESYNDYYKRPSRITSASVAAVVLV